MNKQFFNWFFLLTFLFIKEVNSRPISYAGGWTIMQMNDFNKHSIHLHFSPTIRYSLGYKGEYWRQKEWQFHGVQLNYLIERLNNPKSQANFYLKNGLGIALNDFKHHERKIEPSVFTGFAFDWEDRQYFTSYENRLNFNPTIEKFFLQKARIGIAPYTGEYGDLHTWFMFQVEHMPHSKNKIVYTPMLRMFKII